MLVVALIIVCGGYCGSLSVLAALPSFSNALRVLCPKETGPCTLQEPTAFDPSSRPWLKFPKLVQGRTAQLLINLRNNGAMRAAARLEMDSHPAFRLLEGLQVRADLPMRYVNYLAILS